MKQILVLMVGVVLLFAYRDESTQTVTDTETNLMWQDDSAAGSVQKTWEGAIAHCEDLTLGGYSDWRLPSRKELLSIVDYSTYDPAISSVFQNVTSLSYWSSTSWSKDPIGGLIVEFSDGESMSSNKENDEYVRCVRGAQ